MFHVNMYLIMKIIKTKKKAFNFPSNFYHLNKFFLFLRILLIYEKHKIDMQFCGYLENKTTNSYSNYTENEIT